MSGSPFVRVAVLAVLILSGWASRATAQQAYYYWGNQGTDVSSSGSWSGTFPPGNSYEPAFFAPEGTTSLNFVPYSYGAPGPVNPNIGTGQSAFSATFAPNFQFGGWVLSGNSDSEFTMTGSSLTTYGPTSVIVNGPALSGTGTNRLVMTLTTGSSLTFAGDTFASSNLTATTSTAATILLRGGTFRLDNFGTNLSNRVADAGGVHMSGGAFEFVGNAAGSSETLHDYWYFAGANTIRVTHTSASAATALTFASINRGGNTTAGGATGNVNFVNVGGSFGSGNSPRVIFSSAPTVTNGAITISGSAGHTTVNGTDFATYSASTGVTALAPTNVSGTLTDSPTTNARLTGDGTISGSSNVAFHTLKIDPSASGQSLSITGSGALSTTGILLAGSRDFTIQNTGGGTGGLTAGATRFIHVSNPNTTLNVGVALGSDQPLVKAGDGFLALTGTSSQIGTANYTINAGTLRVSAANFPNTTGTLQFRGGVLEITGGSNGTGASADFTRGIGTGPNGTLLWDGGPRNRGSGGFSAFGSAASVNIGGATTSELGWNSDGFVPDGYALIFGSTKADARLTFHNPIILTGPSSDQGYTLREIRVIDNANSAGDIATLAGAISGQSASVDLLKTGGGTLELTATNTYAGGTLATGGTLRLSGTAGKLASPNLNFGGGTLFEIDNSANNVSGRLTDTGGPRLTLGGATLRLIGHSSSSASETFDGLTLNPGASSIIATNTRATVTLGDITRTAAGGTVAFSSTGTINTSSSVTSGILGGFATRGDDWAAKSGNQIVAYTGYETGTLPALWNSTDNVKIAAAPTASSLGQTVNSLNFTSSQTLTVVPLGTLVVTSGGVMASASGTISGGTLTANNAAQGYDLIAIVNGSSTFTIGSVIADNGGNAVGLTKSGPGTLVVTGTNTYTGRTTIGQGTLAGTGTVSGATTVHRGATIRGGAAGTTGTLTVANSLTLEAGAVLLVAASRTGDGTANASKINVTGSGSVLNLNPGTIPGETIVIEVASNSGSPLQAGESYNLTLASVATAGNIRLNDSPLPANSVIGPGSYTLRSSDFANFSDVSLGIDNTGKNLVLTFTTTPVPEPATVLAIAAGALALGRAVRRRSRLATA